MNQSDEKNQAGDKISKAAHNYRLYVETGYFALGQRIGSEVIEQAFECGVAWRDANPSPQTDASESVEFPDEKFGNWFVEKVDANDEPSIRECAQWAWDKRGEAQTNAANYWYDRSQQYVKRCKELTQQSEKDRGLIETLRTAIDRRWGAHELQVKELEAENQRLRSALEKIANEHDGRMGNLAARALETKP